MRYFQAAGTLLEEIWKLPKSSICGSIFGKGFSSGLEHPRPEFFQKWLKLICLSFIGPCGP